MNMNQFTQKSLEAVQNAQTIAQEYGNQQIEQPHLLLALLLLPGVLGVDGVWIAVPFAELACWALSIGFLAAKRNKYHYV